MDFIPPEYKAEGFHCPYCNTYAHQEWYAATSAILHPPPLSTPSHYLGLVEGFEFSKCARCFKSAAWYQSNLVYPTTSIAPLPTQDMPVDIIVDFNEARGVLAISPRSSAALLRLAIQKLCKHLGQPGKSINDDIGALVKAGLPPRIQKALDVVRVIGNNAVHPGEIDLNDDQDTALLLFKLVNLIVDDRITHTREIDEVYNKLPESARKGIEQRDRTA